MNMHTTHIHTSILLSSALFLIVFGYIFPWCSKCNLCILYIMIIYTSLFLPKQCFMWSRSLLSREKYIVLKYAILTQCVIMCRKLLSNIAKPRTFPLLAMRKRANSVKMAAIPKIIYLFNFILLIANNPFN